MVASKVYQNKNIKNEKQIKVIWRDSSINAVTDNVQGGHSSGNTEIKRINFRNNRMHRKLLKNRMKKYDRLKKFPCLYSLIRCKEQHVRPRKVKTELYEKLPWSSRKEFVHVYKALFSNDYNDIVFGLTWLGKWDIKTTKLPGGIEATQAFIRAFVQDLKYVKGGFKDNHELRELYALAIARFINIVTEYEQKGKYKQSLASIGLKLHIPQWVTEIRHDSVHSDLPPLDILRKCAYAALMWLKHYYWRREIAAMLKADKNSMEELIKKTLFDFQCAHLKILCCPEIQKPEFFDISELLYNIIKVFIKNKRAFIDAFVHHQTIVPDNEILHIILTEKEHQFILSEKLLEFPESLIKLWMPLIEVFDKNNCIEDFLVSLLLSWQGKNIYQGKFIIAFAIKLIDAILHKNNGTEYNPSSLFEIYYHNHKPPSLNWSRILNACLAYPCDYTLELITRIFEHGDFENDFKSSLLNVLVVFLGKCADDEKSTPLEHKLITVHGLHKMKLADKSGKEIYSEHDYAYGHNWMNIPFGTNLSKTETFIRPGHENCSTPELSDDEESKCETSLDDYLFKDFTVPFLDIREDNNKNESESSEENDKQDTKMSEIESLSLSMNNTISESNKTIQELANIFLYENPFI